ncbi:MAG: alpha/beta fold hydrolase [Nakamurella sp.]
MELTRTLMVAGDSIAWDVFGTGPPVVLVHGFPSTSYLWRHVAPLLAGMGRQVYVYDLLGFGASAQHEAQNVWLTGQARVLGALLDAWEIERPVIIAHDMGAGAAVVLAATEERRFERLVLVSAGVLAPVIASSTEHMLSHLETYRSMPVAPWEAIIRARVSTATHVPLASADLERYVRPWLGAAGKAAFLRVVAQIGEERTSAIEDTHARLDVPVHVVWGEEDTWLPVEMAEHIRDLVPGAVLTVIPGAGHFLPDDTPAAFGRLLADVQSDPRDRVKRPEVRPRARAVSPFSVWQRDST